MSWVDIAVAPRHEAAASQAKVVAVLKGAINLSEVRARVRYSEVAPMGVVEEFVIRCVLELRVVSPEQIAAFLGFPDESFVEPVLKNCRSAGLLGDEWVEDAPWLRALRECWESGRVPRTVTRTVDAWLEPVSGVLTAEQDALLTRIPMREKPEEAALSAGSDSEWRRYLAGRDLLGAGARILELEPDVVGAGLRELEVVVSISEASSDWTWEPCDPASGEILPAMFDACMDNGADEAAHAAMEKLAVPEEAISTKKETLPEVADAARQLADRAESARVGSYNAMEARREFIAAIAAARSEVILDYPWIKRGAINAQMLTELQKAVDRGVRIYVLWGIAQRQADEDSHADAIADLARIGSKNCAGALAVAWAGNSHAKQALFDGARLFGGGHNLLSFRPDPSRGAVRLETTYDFRGELHQHLYEEFRENFRRRIDVVLLQRAQTSPQDAALYLALSGDSGKLNVMLDGLPAGAEELKRLEWMANAVADRQLLFSDADRKRVAKTFEEAVRRSGITLAGLPGLRKVMQRLKS